MKNRDRGARLDKAARENYDDEPMRVYEVILCSGVRAEILAEVMHDDKAHDHIYFFRDKGMNHQVAYFLRKDISGIVFGAEKGAMTPPSRFK